MMRSILFLFVYFFCSTFDSTAQSDEDEPDDFTYDKSTHSVRFSDTLFYAHDSTKILKRLGNYLQDHRFKTDNQDAKTFHRNVSFEVHALENRGKVNNVLGNVEYLLTVEIKKTDIIVTYTGFLFIENHQKKGRPLDKTFPNKLKVLMERERVKARFYEMLD